MAKFRKIQVEIEAVQYLGGDDRGKLRFSGDVPDWLMRAMTLPGNIPGAVCIGYGASFIWTQEGPLDLKPGAWIIRGVEGEIYPCSDSVFCKTYVAADAKPAVEMELEPVDKTTVRVNFPAVAMDYRDYGKFFPPGHKIQAAPLSMPFEEYVTAVARKRCELEARVIAGAETWESLGVLAREERRRQARNHILHTLAVTDLLPLAPEIGEG